MDGIYPSKKMSENLKDLHFFQKYIVDLSEYQDNKNFYLLSWKFGFYNFYNRYDYVRGWSHLYKILNRIPYIIYGIRHLFAKIISNVFNPLRRSFFIHRLSSLTDISKY
jgi:hypothetical protein